MNFGKYDAGDMIVTLPGDSVAYDMGEFDRVLTLNATEVFQLPLVSGKNDKIAFTVVSIDQIYWIDRGVIVYGELPSIDAQGNLTWIQDKPALGVQYTICGQRRSEYFCYMDLPSNRGEHSGAPLPRNVVLKKFDLFSR